VIDSVQLTVRQPGVSDQLFTIREGATRIGRAEDNDVVLSDVGVSRRHARLLITRDRVRIEDLGSGNGTYFKGVRVQSQEIADGDEVVIDPFVMRFRVLGAPRHGAPSDEPTIQNQLALARLDVLSGGGMVPSSFPIGPRGLTIGRSENRDVVIADPAASRHHCSILPRNEQYILRDMGSANGVFVNSMRVRETMLADGDRVRIGNTDMRFTVNDPTVVDSTTMRVPAAAWQPPQQTNGQGWERDLSLPVPEVLASAPRVRSRGGAMRWVAAGALGVVLLAVVTSVTVFAIVAIAVMVQRNSGPTPEVRAALPPSWTLELPPGLPAATVDTLFTEGIDALQTADTHKALESFYRALQADPGNPSAERLSFAAGEFLVLDALEPQMKARAAEVEAYETERTTLLSKARLRGKRGLAARRALTADYGEDPVVLSTLNWREPDAVKARRDLADVAAQHANQEEWVAALTAYDQVADAQDPALRDRARAGQKVARRELARAVATRWQQAVVAEAEGSLEQARAAYREVLAVDPANPSALIRLERLGGDLSEVGG
jgi:pSer/pThr/pTyr-binding forkhead associated (FHA) protein